MNSYYKNWYDSGDVHEPDLLEFDYDTRAHSPLTVDLFSACSSNPDFDCYSNDNQCINSESQKEQPACPNALVDGGTFHGKFLITCDAQQTGTIQYDMTCYAGAVVHWYE